KSGVRAKFLTVQKLRARRKSSGKTKKRICQTSNGSANVRLKRSTRRRFSRRPARRDAGRSWSSLPARAGIPETTAGGVAELDLVALAKGSRRDGWWTTPSSVRRHVSRLQSGIRGRQR